MVSNRLILSTLPSNHKDTLILPGKVIIKAKSHTKGISQEQAHSISLITNRLFTILIKTMGTIMKNSRLIRLSRLVISQHFQKEMFTIQFIKLQTNSIITKMEFMARVSYQVTKPHMGLLQIFSFQDLSKTTQEDLSLSIIQDLVTITIVILPTMNRHHLETVHLVLTISKFQSKMWAYKIFKKGLHLEEIAMSLSQHKSWSEVLNL